VGRERRGETEAERVERARSSEVWRRGKYRPADWTTAEPQHQHLPILPFPPCIIPSLPLLSPLRWFQRHFPRFPAMSASRDSVASSGITFDASTGERYIPSSVRADGSKRREIRVRPGYRPPEDVELYRNRAAEAWKNRGKAGVPGTEGLSKQPEQTEQTKTASAASNKNAKRREAKKKAKAADESDTTEGRDVVAIDNWRAFAAGAERNDDQKLKEVTATAAPAESAVDQDAENEKKARNLKKKLRQARDLRDKKSQGESLLPEQVEKVIKIQELVRQLDALGFDSNGDKKNGASEGKDV
jgi:partner of Y14 and mago protein